MKDLGYKICHILEILRYVIIFCGVFIAELYHSSQQQFAIIAFTCIISIAGLSGIEGYFFGKYSSRIVGYSDSGPYQRQSALNNLALTLATIIAYLMNWGIHAQLALISVLMFFLLLSGLNHALDTIKHGNKSLRNFLRPIGSLVLILTILSFMLPVLKL
jgi:predicted benzoate:H+ symporter BenE